MLTQPELLFLIQASIIVALPLLLWRVSWIRAFAPLVIVQILVGIFLGPSLLGHFLPSVYESLFPAHSLVSLTGIAWMGLALLGFLTGLHFNINTIRQHGGAFAVTSLSTLLIPAALGVIVAALFMHPPYTVSGVAEWLQVAGIAVAVSVTALPVLSAILLELNLIDSPIGRRVLGYAVFNDIALWIAVAALTGYMSSAGDNTWQVGAVKFCLAALFLIVMLGPARKLVSRLRSIELLGDTPSMTQLALVLAGIFASGFATELIGIHFLLGAFVFGAIMPKSVSHGLYAYFEKFTLVAITPFFFVLTGLKTDISFSDSSNWILFACVTCVAIVGKLVGSFIPEYLLYKSRPSVALQVGVLMQTKGLMEVVVLNILLAAGIINTLVFSALVMMAIATTLLTKPLLLIVSSKRLSRT